MTKVLMNNFTNAKYDNVGDTMTIFWEVQIATGLKELNVHVNDDFLVNHLVNPLSMEFE